MLCLPQLYFNSITVPKIYCNYSKIFQSIFLLVILFFFFLQYLLLPLSSTYISLVAVCEASNMFILVDKNILMLSLRK